MVTPKTRKTGSSKSKSANSPAHSTPSSSKLYPETSIDCHSSPLSSSARSKAQILYTESLAPNGVRSKENVTVTVRFRPLSPREIHRGEEIAWYADGETIVRNENNPSIAYAYDRVFSPTTTTRHVYDVAAQHIINGAMEGINGTIFAYGVTSSGKTHTMHGDQRSPGIIPLAVKDVFSIIQETPNREFLLRVSYMEIYNEVVNDLLNPAGQNLRIREDGQGTFIEGIKEEVVLSPAHALSLIAAGEEHRHVGSTNFNLLSSRSHTIFTLTVESSPLGENNEGEAVHLSQLNLIDLAGSESSKAGTSGLRRKEGSYINKSLLTLGTVISKLTDGRTSHVPYRDSKLTRILQSSLSGHGRVSMICTVTPASSNSEETHNTLKFAHRTKHIEIKAAQNKIIDEKSLIKKYQNEIRKLKEELDQLKRGMLSVPQLKDISEDDIVLLKQKLEDGQVKLQSRLEEEEEAKAALLGRIQRLTKLILVSTKTPQSSRLSHRANLFRRHSFGEEELAYLPYKRRDLIDDDNLDLYVPLQGDLEVRDDASTEEKKTRKLGLLDWLKPKKRENNLGLSSLSDNSTPSSPRGGCSNAQTESSLSEITQDREAPGVEVEIRNLDDDIKTKNNQIAALETEHTLDIPEIWKVVAELRAQLDEKSFELEVKTADNRIIQEQLSQKMCECEALQGEVANLKQQLSALDIKNERPSSEERNDQDIIQSQKAEIEELKKEVVELSESKEQLEHGYKKLGEESSYAKGLASAAAVELKTLSEEVTKLMNQNERLAAEMTARKNTATPRNRTGTLRNGQRDNGVKRQQEQERSLLAMKKEHQLSYDALVVERDQREAQLQMIIDESKQREADLENELTNMWLLVTQLKRFHGDDSESSNQ